MEVFVHGDLEALSAGGKKSGAASANSPAACLRGGEHPVSAAVSTSHKYEQRDNILTKTSCSIGRAVKGLCD